MEKKSEKTEVKKPYKTPTLAKYGKVEQVTKGSGVGTDTVIMGSTL